LHLLFGRGYATFCSGLLLGCCSLMRWSECTTKGDALDVQSNRSLPPSCILLSRCTGHVQGGSRSESVFRVRRQFVEHVDSHNLLARSRIGFGLRIALLQHRCKKQAFSLKMGGLTTFFRGLGSRFSAGWHAAGVFARSCMFPMCATCSVAASGIVTALKAGTH
jgi:hypothetical protein